MKENLLLRFSLLRVIPAKFTSSTAQHTLDILLRAPLKGIAPYTAMGDKPVPVELVGPGLLAWSIFPFLIYRCDLRATVYGSSTLVTKVVQAYKLASSRC